jgi:hypothetical protein
MLKRQRLVHIGIVGLTAALAACGSDGDDGDSDGDNDDVDLCGNGVCNAGESTATCEVDCPATATCGDGTCSGSETAANCAADCAATACSPNDPDSCSGSDICIVDACEPAFGRTYEVSVFNLTINTTNQKGTSWDSVGGAPDPYVVISINDGELLYTSEVQDTFEPTFADSTTVVIPAGAKFRFDAWDSDVDPADWIIGCEIDPLTADYLRAFGPTCTGTAETGTLGTVLDLLIVPNG